jgi:hypothetical protein
LCHAACPVPAAEALFSFFSHQTSIYTVDPHSSGSLPGSPTLPVSPAEEQVKNK